MIVSAHRLHRHRSTCHDTRVYLRTGAGQGYAVRTGPLGDVWWVCMANWNTGLRRWEYVNRIDGVSRTRANAILTACALAGCGKAELRLKLEAL